jgi:uncharacterized DUF497 family protein
VAGVTGGQFLQVFVLFSSVEALNISNTLGRVSFCLEMDLKCVHTFVNTLMYTLVQWDEAKNRRNVHKLGIGFPAAAGLFNYPHLVRFDTREDYREDRWIGVGWIGAMIGVVVFTMSESEDRDTNIIRILSARKATKREVELFEQEVKN